MAPNPPRFIVLDYPIPAADVSTMLARFVVDYTSPLDRSAPSNLPDFTKEYVYDCGNDTNVSILLQSSSNETIRGKLDRILSLAASRDNTRHREIDSECVKTYRLRDHDKVFDRLGRLPDVKNEVDMLFYRPGKRVRQLYMIVGVKTVQNATSKTEKGGSSNKETTASLPIGASLVAAGIPANPSSKVGAEWRQSSSSSATYEGTHHGEQVFAIEYRVVKKRLFSSWRGGDSMKLGDIKSYGWGEGTMAGGSDSDSDSDFEDGSEEENEEEDNSERFPAIGNLKSEMESCIFLD